MTAACRQRKFRCRPSPRALRSAPTPMVLALIVAALPDRCSPGRRFAFNRLIRLRQSRARGLERHRRATEAAARPGAAIWLRCARATRSVRDAACSRTCTRLRGGAPRVARACRTARTPCQRSASRPAGRRRGLSAVARRRELSRACRSGSPRWRTTCRWRGATTTAPCATTTRSSSPFLPNLVASLLRLHAGRTFFRSRAPLERRGPAGQRDDAAARQRGPPRFWTWTPLRCGVLVVPAVVRRRSERWTASRRAPSTGVPAPTADPAGCVPEATVEPSRRSRERVVDLPESTSPSIGGRLADRDRDDRRGRRPATRSSAASTATSRLCTPIPFRSRIAAAAMPRHRSVSRSSPRRSATARPEPHHTRGARQRDVRVYIGQTPTRRIEPGPYTYHADRTGPTTQLGFFSDHDQLYWNVTGNGWAFPIDSCRRPNVVAAARRSARGRDRARGLHPARKDPTGDAHLGDRRRPAQTGTPARSAAIAHRSATTRGSPSWPDSRKATSTSRPATERRDSMLISSESGSLVVGAGLGLRAATPTTSWPGCGSGATRAAARSSRSSKLPLGLADAAACRYLSRHGHTTSAASPPALVGLAAKGWARIAERTAGRTR